MPADQNNVETAFHRRRKAFVFLDGGVLIAADGFAGSHFDLLTVSGFDENQARAIIENNPRGYALDGDVYLYQGTDFSVLNERNRRLASAFLPILRQYGYPGASGKIFDGMKAGAVGEKWSPVKEF